MQLSSKEQQSGIEQINDAVTQLDQQTQTNAAAALETNEIAIGTEKLAETIINEANSKEFKGKDTVEDRREQCRDLNFEKEEKREAEALIKDNSKIQVENKKSVRTTPIKNNDMSKEFKSKIVKSNYSSSSDKEDEWESF